MPLTFLRNARFCCGLAGAALALVAPLGWLLVCRLTGSAPDSQTLYLYLTLGALIAFTAAGVGIGHLYERVKLLSERDDLTGIFNQNAFLRTGAFLLQLAMRHREPIAVLMMDIDHFKDVNDNHNHLVGSHVLKELARIIENSTRKSDLIARFGGDEYVLCLPRTGLDDAKIVAERIRSSVDGRTFTLRNHAVQVTVSIGIAGCNADKGLDLSRLIEAADQALYAAKDQGRNCVVGQTYAG